MRLIVVVLVVLVMNGCALMNRPTAEQLANADYGSFPRNYQATVKEYMDNVLKDPPSAIYSDWRGPVTGAVSTMSGAFFGYRVCVMVNAKNSYGGYTGKQPHTFVIKNDSIIQYKGGGVSGTLGLEESYNLCNSISVTPTNIGRFVIGIESIIVQSDGKQTNSKTEAIGAKVSSVAPNSRAQKAGIVVGDVITKIGATEVRSGVDIPQSISAMNVGDSVVVVVLRNSKPLELKLTY